MCLEILAFVKQVVVVFALDEIDKKILVELLTNSNRSNREIARAINVSAATVINRIQRLESAGVIKDYTVMLDYERLGFELTVIMEVTVSKGKLLEVQEEIAKLPYVCGVYDVTGEIDSIVIAKFRNRRELSEFPKALLAMENVERTNTHVVLNTIKEDFRMVRNL
ncbi:MAG TPA: Lrp/AsnC family transcriptional regulator [Candidatus Bathyarchaeota archaeon]|nr:Lrp/AsnC family transcriptional regulator [Candidatus Bathyarchaeota archaeon]